MPTLAEISALVNTLGPSLGLEEGHEWIWGQAVLDMDTYHRAVILVSGDWGPETLAALPATFELRARAKGFRLLKMTQMGSPMTVEGYTFRTYSAYAASDVWEKPISDLSAALYGAPVVVDKVPVSLAEKATLDALWITKGETLPKVEHELSLGKGLALGLTAIIGVSLLLWATIRAR